LPRALQEKYFSQSGEKSWTVSPDLQRRVTYDVVNLVDADAVASHAGAPIIFCRNVFIYFSDKSIHRAVDAFARAMPDPAFLCVGVSESLLRLATRFELREIGGAFVYVRDGGAPARSPFAVAASGERN
jgi:chemotaxis protein methyltransferase CheR